MHIEEGLKADIESIKQIPFLPVLLDVICAATGMGFAAVARVTEERWIAGAVKDEIQFGLMPGGELPVQSTICHEIRQSKMPVVIDHVAKDTLYCKHHTPAQYGFESYISFPIIMGDGSFYGTLCAIDPEARELNTPAIVDLFTTLSSLIAQYLDGKKTFSASNIGKLEMYAAAELNNLHLDMAAGETGQHQKMHERRMMLLSMKVNQLLIMMEPQGAFLA